MGFANLPGALMTSSGDAGGDVFWMMAAARAYFGGLESLLISLAPAKAGTQGREHRLKPAHHEWRRASASAERTSVLAAVVLGLE
jgi:hypothetical protein